jgi:hypothetical protein
MHRIENSILLFCLASLCSCGVDPGSADYSYSLPDDFSIYRTSGHQVEIASQSALPGVPAKVIEVGWDKRFIIAKQQLLKNRGDFPGDNFQVPDPSKYQFWIIDVLHTNRVGPLDEKAFKEKRTALDVPDTIKMKPPGANVK